MPRPGLEPGPFDPESSALTIRPPRLPHSYYNTMLLCCEHGSHRSRIVFDLVATGQEMVRKKIILQGPGKVRDFEEICPEMLPHNSHHKVSSLMKHKIISNMKYMKMSKSPVGLEVLLKQ